LFLERANAWEFETVVDLGLIYTDNLRLQEKGLEESDLIYLLAPTFMLANDGDRLEADIRYRPEALFYHDTDDANNVYHQIDGRLTYSLVRNALFFYASVVNFQTILSPEDTIPTSNIPITGNRVDTNTLELRPYWEQSLGTMDVLLEAGYVKSRYDDVETAAPSLFTLDNEQYGAEFKLDNHERSDGFAWGVNYWIRRVEYENTIPWEFQQFALDLGHWFGTGLRLFVSGGVETPYDSYVDSSMDADFWEAGFQYTPNQRLDLEVAAGQRSFGNTYRLSLNYRLRRGETRLSYSESPSTQAEDWYDYRPLDSVKRASAAAWSPCRQAPL
jgi:uncharacterized protein (PEP-CTERM system associated)